MIKKKTHKNSFLKDLPKNIFSGFVVSLIALPLGLGLAIASDAPPISGIIAAIVGGMVVSVFGGSNVTIAGPGNGLVIVLLGAITTLANGDLQQGYLYTIAAVVISGVLMMILGLVRMGKLGDFFPSSAINGMLAAIGIGILSKQFHVMVGNNDIKGSIVELLIAIPSSCIEMFYSPSDSRFVAEIVGVGSLAIMVFYSKIRNKYFQLIPAPMWIILLAISLKYIYEALGKVYPLEQKHLISIPNKIMEGFAFPDFGIAYTSEFIGVVLAITLISSIESLLSIKAVDKLDPLNRRSNVNKDLKALGLATTLSGLVGGLNVVTVIARSSVNVNNGATNRSGNFFHALFLVIFILVFQQQLKNVPLSALAAILVYTGYKLAEPQRIIDAAKIGKEQLLIFLVTMLTTIFTSLITGIVAGILITFLIHVLVNKSFSFFFRKLFMPNVLLFKEHDTDNYYVSVKNFANFLNLNKFKEKLNAIPEHEDAIVDFSLCSFIDHTVMESLNDYQKAFEKKGGALEIVGMDKHMANSMHPFALRIDFPFSKIVPQNVLSFTNRKDNLAKMSSDFSWRYLPEKNEETQFLNSFIFFRTRQIHFIYNRVCDPDFVFNIMDIEFSEGEFIAKEVVRSTVCYVKLNTEIPEFSLDREGLLERIYHLAGFRDIEIPNAPDFTKRFFLRGEHKNDIITFFNKELVLFFESNPYYHVESNGSALLIMKKERIASIKEIKALIDFGKRLRVCIHQAQKQC